MKERFIKQDAGNGKGIGIFDRERNLMWSICDAGSMEFNKINYPLSFVGFDNWRIPTIQELTSIIDYETSDPMCYLPNHTSGRYWSFTKHFAFEDGIWIVNFRDGKTDFTHEDDICYIRYVRTLTINEILILEDM